MSLNTLILIIFIFIFVILLLIIWLLLKIKRLEEKSIDVSARDIVTFVEQMREMVLESERTAERLDIAIKEKEAILEDLCSLVESRINRLQQLSVTNNLSDTKAVTAPKVILPPQDTSKQNQVYNLLFQGHSEAEIASIMGISVAEVELILNISKS